jgi:NAD(P)-dependent dehydrogenase (short-subunit alcohol dehydrogenase family)
MAIVLVTGASGGIGSAICRVLARRGATLALHYQADPEGAEQARRSLEGSGHVLVQADLAAPASIERLWREVARLGPSTRSSTMPASSDHPPLASSYEQWTRAWERTLAVNLVGAAHLPIAPRTMRRPRAGSRQRLFARRLSRRPTLRPMPPVRRDSPPSVSRSPRRWRRAASTSSSWPRAGSRRARVRASGSRPAVIADQPLGRVHRRGGRARGELLRTGCTGQHDGAILDVNGASYLRN